MGSWVQVRVWGCRVSPRRHRRPLTVVVLESHFLVLSKPLFRVHHPASRMGVFDPLNSLGQEIYDGEDGSQVFLLRSTAASSKSAPTSWRLVLFELDNEGQIVNIWEKHWDGDEIDELVRLLCVLLRDGRTLMCWPPRPLRQLERIPDKTPDALWVDPP